MSSAGRGGHQENRADDASVRRPVVEPAGDQIGGEHRQGQLHQFRRLETELAEPHPPARAFDVDPEAGYQDDHEEAEGDEQQKGAQPAQPVVIEAQRRDERDHADRHPHALSDEDRPRASVERDGDHRRGGTHHHQSDDAEERHDHGQNRPGRELVDDGHEAGGGPGPCRAVHGAPLRRVRGAGGRPGVARRHGRLPADLGVRVGATVRRRPDTRHMRPVFTMANRQWWSVVT